MLRGQTLKVLLLLFFWLVSQVVSLPGYAEEKPYLLGKGDVLSVTILAGGTRQESIDLTVSSKGTIYFPFLGEIKAAGLTIPQITEIVLRPLAQDYFVNPQVIINVKDYKSKKVYITGAIEKSGLYTLDGSTTLIELIAQAGGVTKERGNVAYVIKGSLKELKDNKEIGQLVSRQPSIEVNLRELLDQGITSKNVELDPNDVIYIQPTNFSDVAQYKVYVDGKVEKPGVVDYQEGLTALNACTMADGFAKYSAPGRTIITRTEANGAHRKINANLDKIRKGEEKAILLKPGDRIFVPES